MLARGTRGASAKSLRRLTRCANRIGNNLLQRKGSKKGRGHPLAADGASAAASTSGSLIDHRRPDYFNRAQYGIAPGRSCFGGLGFLNVINSTRPLDMSVGRTESALRRQFIAALRASSSKAGWPLLRRMLVLVTRPLLFNVRESTTDPWRPCI